MASDLHLRGVYVPLVTPFGPDGEVALEALAELARSVLDAGAAGIVALGTTGEVSMLDAAERDAVVAVCSEVCVERGASLVVGAGTADTRGTLARHRALAGVPGVVASLCVTPYYVRPSEAQVVEHLRTVAAASPVPVVVYNIPYRTGRGLGATALLELAATDNVAGVKQSVGAVDADTLALLARAPEGFHVLAGDDAFILPLVCMGASGAIAASAHLCTDRFVALVDCGLTAKLDEGRRLAAALLPVVDAAFAEPNPAVIKGVLAAQGRIPTAELRSPMAAASPAAVARALAAVAEVC